MKTGTTYLQNVLRENSADLLAQGVYYPAGADVPSQRHAVWDLVGRRTRGSRDDRIAGQWQALTEAVARTDASTVVLSEEYLASATGRQARRAVAGFPDREVHVLVTARDLGRVLSSAWQEEVKNGSTRTWGDYLAAVRDPRQRGQDPARAFWLRHDLPGVVDTWAGVVGPERLHMVTVPPPGAPREVLLSRVGGLVGFDPSRLSDTSPRANESLGAPATEVLRRVNERLHGRLNERQYDKVVKLSLQRRLAGARQTQPPWLPREDVEWATAEAERMIGHLATGRYDVVGALDELLPVRPADADRPKESRTEAGRAQQVRTDQVRSEELLEASIDAMTALAEDYASTWWRLRQADVARVAPRSAAVRAASAVRGAGFRVRRVGADFADRNRIGATAMRVYLRLRR